MFFSLILGLQNECQPARSNGGPHHSVLQILWERGGQVQAQQKRAEEHAAGGTLRIPGCKFPANYKKHTLIRLKSIRIGEIKLKNV